MAPNDNNRRAMADNLSALSKRKRNNDDPCAVPPDRRISAPPCVVRLECRLPSKKDQAGRPAGGKEEEGTPTAKKPRTVQFALEKNQIRDEVENLAEHRAPSSAVRCCQKILHRAVAPVVKSGDKSSVPPSPLAAITIGDKSSATRLRLAAAKIADQSSVARPRSAPPKTADRSIFKSPQHSDLSMPDCGASAMNRSDPADKSFFKHPADLAEKSDVSMPDWRESEAAESVQPLACSRARAIEWVADHPANMGPAQRHPVEISDISMADCTHSAIGKSAMTGNFHGSGAACRPSIWQKFVQSLYHKKASSRTATASKRDTHKSTTGDVSMVDCKASETRCPAEARKRADKSIVTSSAHQNKNAPVPCEVEMDDPEDSILGNGEAGRGNAADDEYAEDVYTFYSQTEVFSFVSDYMSSQPDINEGMRTSLIDSLIVVHAKYNLSPETLFLMVNLIDRYLSNKRVRRRELPLIGVTALYAASKYVELDFPDAQDLINVSGLFCPKEELFNMERIFLYALHFDVYFPTPHTFLSSLLKEIESDIELEMVSFFLGELSLLEYCMLSYPASMLAAAAVYTGRCVLGRVPHWNRLMKRHTTYAKNQLRKCAKMMVQFHGKAQKTNSSVYRKYSSGKYNFVAKHNPAIFS